jgi:predicted Rossmann fold nucleotide-binding protein DprA/Smf involved in DNA uptake
MWAAIDEGGSAIGVLADSLAAAVLTRRNRHPILDGQLLLMSPFDPNARFTVAHAMERNRYLYALAAAAVIVDSDVKGGTWSGAIENQKHGWTTAFVRTNDDSGPGNERLAAFGLIPLLDRGVDLPPLRSLIEADRSHEVNEEQALLPLSNPPISTELNTALPEQDAAALLDFFLSRLQSVLGERGKTEDENCITLWFGSRPSKAVARACPGGPFARAQERF